LSGFFEPLLYLRSIGHVVGKLIGRIPSAVANRELSAFVKSPAMLASSAMTVSLAESPFHCFTSSER